MILINVGEKIEEKYSKHYFLLTELIIRKKLKEKLK